MVTSATHLVYLSKLNKQHSHTLPSFLRRCYRKSIWPCCSSSWAPTGLPVWFPQWFSPQSLPPFLLISPHHHSSLLPRQLQEFGENQFKRHTLEPYDGFGYINKMCTFDIQLLLNLPFNIFVELCMGSLKVKVRLKLEYCGFCARGVHLASTTIPGSSRTYSNKSHAMRNESPQHKADEIVGLITQTHLGVFSVVVCSHLLALASLVVQWEHLCKDLST